MSWLPVVLHVSLQRSWKIHSALAPAQMINSKTLMEFASLAFHHVLHALDLQQPVHHANLALTWWEPPASPHVQVDSRLLMMLVSFVHHHVYPVL